MRYRLVVPNSDVLSWHGPPVMSMVMARKTTIISGEDVYQALKESWAEKHVQADKSDPAGVLRWAGGMFGTMGHADISDLGITRIDYEVRDRFVRRIEYFVGTDAGRKVRPIIEG